MDELTITRCDNGFEISYWEDFEDEREPEKHRLVFESQDGDFGEETACVNMLFEIVELFGLTGNKHDAKRIIIKLEDQNDFTG